MKKHFLLILIFVALIWLLAACFPKQNSVNTYLGVTVPKAAIDDYIEKNMAERDIPGLSLAIINQGEVVYTNSYGYAQMVTKKPVTSKTIFEGASISKPLFAYFVMTFVEEGQLDLDRPLHDYLPHPDLADDPRIETMTARMVLSHRGGFPNWREDEPDKKLRIKFDPGSDYLYSGEGYQYLALVLREIEQTDWVGLEAIFQERVAQPLGMTHTVFIQTPYTRQYKAEPYDVNGEAIAWEDSYTFLKEDGNFYAPSSIHSEPADFSKWMIAVMNGALLTAESYEQLLAPHSQLPSDEIPTSYTLGFITPHLPFTNLYAHSGNNVGFTSWFALDIKRDWGFVMFTNSDNGETFGEALFFYLFAGPSLPKLLVTIGLVGLTLLFAIIVIIDEIRQRKHQSH